VNRQTQIIVYSTLLVCLVVGAVLSFALAADDALAQLLDPTEQRETVEALVEMRFTQTVEALGLEATADRLFADALTATSMVDLPPPSATPTPTPLLATGTPLPIFSPTPTPLPLDAPQAAAQLLAEGWLAFWEQRDSTAIDLFTQVIEMQPDWVEGYRSRALLHYINGSNADSIADYTRALELDPDAALYFGRGLAHEMNFENDAAIADYTRVIDLNPTYVFSYSQRANLYLAAEDYESALADLDQVVFLNPANLFSFDARSLVHEELNNRAERRFDALIVGALDNLFNAEYERALDDLTDALAIEQIDETNLAYAYYNRGVVQTALADNEAALADFERAVELNPALGPAYFEIQLIQDAEGDSAAGLATLDRAIENAPDYASAWLSRAFAYEEAGDFAASSPDYWRWLELINLRDIDWTDRSTVGQPFIVEMEYGHLYRVPFTVTEGATVSAEARTLDIGGSSVDTLLVILDSDGTPLIANDDGGENFNSAIAGFALPGAGTYTLAVGHAGAGSSGPVEVNIKLGTGE
jgi:tetratricopeptide (TPR) repeat protein